MDNLDKSKDMLRKVLINAQKITIEVEIGIILDNVSVSLNDGDRVGLVGPNGSGKSTLMKVMAGMLEPTKGEVQRIGSSYYVPQLDLPLFKSDITLLNYLSEIYDEWWEITEVLKRKFGFTEINIEQPLSTLSGGELVKLHLAIALILNPNCLFLDEPTNHLDLTSIEFLVEFLRGYNGTYVVVSHDPFFLDQVTSSTWEIENKKVNSFGGNYSSYREQKTDLLAGQERQHDAARKELAKVHKAIEKEQKRAARSQKTGREMKHDRGMSAIEKGYFKNKSTGVAGKNKEKLEVAADKATSKVAETKANMRRKAYLDLSTDTSSKGRTLLRASKFNLTLQGGRSLLENVELSVSYGDRIVIMGNNGAGKTLLIKSLLGRTNNVTTEGESYIAPESNIVYLSQKYEIVDPELSLVENMEKSNKDLNYEQIRRLLANFLFLNEDDIRKKANVLSGGEVARLAFAMITSSPVDLLVLDEPTNNLDIDTVDSIVDALEDFKGAIIIISHNIDFLSKIGVIQAYVINKYNLKELESVPEDEEDFYDELISELEQ